MADLRRVTSFLGHTDVATYIQSGNVVFTTRNEESSRLADDLEAAIAETLDVQPGVVVLSRAELARVVADNPFPDESDPKHLHAVLRGDDPDPETLAGIAAAQRRATEKGSRDEARVVGRTLFLRTPDGMGRSELAAQLARTDRGTGRGGRAVREQHGRRAYVHPAPRSDGSSPGRDRSSVRP